MSDTTTGGDFTPSYSGIIADNGAFSEGWTTKAFGADYNGPLAQAKDLSGLDKMLRDSMAAARVKTEGMVRVPGDTATDDERAAFYKALGVPDDPKGYELTKPEKLPDGVAWDDKFADDFASAAKAAGMTKGQVSKVLDWHFGKLSEQSAASKAALESSIAAEKAELQKTFGSNLDAVVNDAKALANAKWMPQSMRDYILNGGVDPTHGSFGGVPFLEMLAAVKKLAGEDSNAGGIKPTTQSGNTVAHWKEVLKDPNHPDYIAAFVKKDPDAVARYNEAFRAEYGGR